MLYFTAGTYLFSSGDDDMKVYFDGVLQYDENGMADTWKLISELKIPSGTRVLGIECINHSQFGGIVASTTDGLVTDETWLCSNNHELEGWAEPEFVDTHGNFSVATILQPNWRY